MVYTRESSFQKDLNDYLSASFFSGAKHNNIAAVF